MSDMVKLNYKEKEEFNQWLAGTEVFAVGDRIIESEEIHIWEVIGEVKDDCWLMSYKGEYFQVIAV